MWVVRAICPRTVVEDAALRLDADLLNAPVNVATVEDVDAADAIVEAYYDHPPELKVIEGLLEGVSVSELTIDRVPDEDWAALSQASLSLVKVGRYHILPGANDNGIRRLARLHVEPSLAFGTGHHDTTRGVLLEIERLSKARRIGSFLDLGCGTAILGMAAARQSAARIVGVDVDPDAVRIAREVIRRNGLSHRIRLVVANGLDRAIVRRELPVDCLVANIQPGPLSAMALDIVRAVRPGGTIILSGILASERRAMIARFLALGLRLRTHRRHGDWVVLTFAR